MRKFQRPADRDVRSPARYASILSGAAALAASGLILAACSSADKLDPFAGQGSPYYSKSGPLPKGGGRYQVGDSYTVAGNTFYPQEDRDYDKVGIASWYGPKFHRRMTSNGEWFDMDYRSAAHPTLPLPSYARVTNLENGRSMIVRINDRGPFVGTRIIDLSKRSAEELGYRNKGKAKVRVTYIGPAPLNDKGQHLDAMNRELDRGTPLSRMIAAADSDVSGGRVQVASAPSAPQPTITPSNDSGGAYFVQAGSYGDPENATRARDRLAGIAPVDITPVNSSIGTLYRVRLGPLATAASANLALDRTRAAGHTDASIVVSQN